LHWAAIKGRKDAIEFLLINGADHNAKTNDGKTPMQYAAQAGYPDVAEILRQHGGHE
jgi:ankyrin repeat protein